MGSGPEAGALDRAADRDGFFVYPGVHVYGGFEGIESLLSERDHEAHPVKLDGDLAEGESVLAPLRDH